MNTSSSSVGCSSDGVCRDRHEHEWSSHPAICLLTPLYTTQSIEISGLLWQTWMRIPMWGIRSVCNGWRQLRGAWVTLIPAVSGHRQYRHQLLWFELLVCKSLCCFSQKLACFDPFIITPNVRHFVYVCFQLDVLRTKKWLNNTFEAKRLNNPA